MKVHCMVLVLATLLPGLSAAQSSGDQRQALAKQVRERFVAADKNADGQLSRDEARSGMPRVFERFDEIDTGGKGFVTPEDLRAHFGERRRKRTGSAS